MRQRNFMKKTSVLRIVLYLVLGVVVGIAAKVPGFSGGALLFAFGLYGTVIETINSPIKSIKKNWLMLICLGVGVIGGYVGFASIINTLLYWNEAIVTSVFVGLIIGTIPELWRDAGERGRGKWSYISLAASFAILFAFFVVIRNVTAVKIEDPGIPAFMLGGFLQGLSFIVPGLSSSSLLLFLGIEVPLNEGLTSFDLKVLLPFGITMAVCVLLLSRIMQLAFNKAYPILSHCVLGFVLATTTLIIPPFNTGVINALIYILAIILSAGASFAFSLLCARIKGGSSEPEVAENNKD